MRVQLTKEPWRGDQSELKLCSFKLGLLLVLANAFFFPFSLLCLLGLVPCTAPPPKLGTSYLLLGSLALRVALSPALLAAKTLLCCLSSLGLAGCGLGAKCQSQHCPCGSCPVSPRP